MAVKGKPMKETKPIVFEPKWDESVNWLEFKADEPIQIRPIGIAYVIAQHWLKTPSKKNFPALCPKFDSNAEAWVQDWNCPCHDDFGMLASQVMIFDVICRELQEKGERNPIRSARLPYTLRPQLDTILQQMKADPADPVKGYDLYIRYMPAQAGNLKWYISRGDRCPLTEEEQAYTLTDFPNIIPDFCDATVRLKQAKSLKTSLARHMYYVIPTGNPKPGQPPWASFKGDPNGEPWINFDSLVEYENGLPPKEKTKTPSGKAYSSKKTDSADDDDLPESFKAKPSSVAKAAESLAAPAQKEDPPEIEQPKAEQPKAEQPKAEPAKPEPAKPEPAKSEPAKPEPAKSEQTTETKSVEQADTAKTSESEKPARVTETHPECFGGWKGNALCLKCDHRKPCLRQSSNDDDE